jgi:hypothetical protein
MKARALVGLSVVLLGASIFHLIDGSISRPRNEPGAIPLPGSIEETEEGLDFPGPPPNSLGIVLGSSAGPSDDNAVVNDRAQAGQLAACTVQSEVSLASFGQNVFVGFNDAQQCQDAAAGSAGTPISWTGFAVSRDGGKSFDDVGPLQPSGAVRNLWGDPVLVVDTVGRDAGTLYMGSLADGEQGSTIAVGTSKDSGESFRWSDAAAEPSSQGGFQDKEWLAVDNSGERATAPCT